MNRERHVSQRGRPGCGTSPDAAGDCGGVTIFVAVAALGLLALAGLVVDGGAKVRSTQRADRVAAEAARAAGQALSREAALTGHLRVDPEQAMRMARAYLDEAGVDGTVWIDPSGARIRIATTVRMETAFLGLIGVPAFTVNGRAEAELISQE